MRVGVVREIAPGETRVSVVPAVVPTLKKAGLEVLVEAGAGQLAGYPDAEYIAHGARVADRSEVLQADVLLMVRAAGAGQLPHSDLQQLQPGQLLIAMCDPLGQPDGFRPLAERGLTVFALELMPRITRAQSMDVLSSMATVSGYRAVLLAAMHLPRMFPMLMTAAGTIMPAKVFVVGAGVAGLQAIATARRLGAAVSAYDVRPAVKEQVQSLGAKFVELGLESQEAEDRGGYARKMGEEFYQRQREMMARWVADSDVVITTAMVPGQKAPVLISGQMVSGMRPGSVIVDLAAERGGNCELTQPGKTIQYNGISILGPLNLPAEVPYHASQMYAKNISTFLLHLLDKQGQINLERDDEILRETLVVRNGQIVHPRIQQLLQQAAA
ncbi:MAG: Re/Si-specific NAD(P)(+) transhydrogenase subunit alpha [Thermoguttaceae bacterium]|nr:Re/Si-specific NAD(P)(+) transhydrogenase subunit alpha [Thermoguttaceae bacterium]MDW8037716.1 Re/Si-specific NAD(P)(+) transhydrogenase subunit alpha [Thermoguttaceae bacterium]